jgi:hypothetical protein
MRSPIIDPASISRQQISAQDFEFRDAPQAGRSQVSSHGIVRRSRSTAV